VQAAAMGTTKCFAFPVSNSDQSGMRLSILRCTNKHANSQATTWML